MAADLRADAAVTSPHRCHALQNRIETGRPNMRYRSAIMPQTRVVPVIWKGGVAVMPHPTNSLPAGKQNIAPGRIAP